jgi:hypothetical protein
MKGKLGPTSIEVLIKHVKSMKAVDKPIFFLDEATSVNKSLESIYSLVRDLLRIAHLAVVLMGTDLTVDYHSSHHNLSLKWCSTIMVSINHHTAKAYCRK